MCVCVCMYTDVSLNAHASVLVCAYVCVPVSIPVCMYVYVSAYVPICACYISTYVYLCLYVHLYLCVHICASVFPSLLLFRCHKDYMIKSNLKRKGFIWPTDYSPSSR